MSVFAPDDTESQKLAKAKNLFSVAAGHFQTSYEEQTTAWDFYHGRQWDSDDAEYLREEGRSVLTMNIIQPRVAIVEGSWSDYAREPRPMPTGAEDLELSKVLDDILNQLREKTDYDGAESEVIEKGMVAGEGDLVLEVERDPSRPGWLLVTAEPVDAREIAWDPSAVRYDRSDARYVFRRRWLTKEEALELYPNKRDEIEQLFADDTTQVMEGSFFSSDMTGTGRDYSTLLGTDVSSNFRKVGQRALIRLEYTRRVRKQFVQTPEGSRELPTAAMGRMMRDRGLDVVSTMVDEAYWFDFMETFVLFDGRSPNPFEGFSITPFVFRYDTETGHAYGMVRSLVDPQQDTNKGWSQSLDHIVSQGKPGWVAEKRAIDDVDKFEEDNNKAGSVATVEDGALTGGMIQERKVPEYSNAAAGRLSASVEFANQASGIQLEPESPGKSQEAATTVLLRERKSMRSLRRPLRNFERYAKEVTSKLMQIIAVMPDDQVQTMLADPKLAVQQNTVFNLETGEQVSLGYERGTEFNVQLNAASESEILRIGQLMILEQIKQTGTPVDPRVLLDLASSSPAIRERLLAFAEQAMAQAAQAQQEQAQSTQAIVAIQAEIERLKLEQKDRQSQRQEATDREKNASDAYLKLLELWEKADLAEKQVLERQIEALGFGPRFAQDRAMLVGASPIALA